MARLYRTALLSPYQRVSRKLPEDLRGFIKLTSGHKINIALAHQERWPDKTAWQEALSGLPVDLDQGIRFQKLRSDQGFFFYAKDIPLD